MMMNSKEMAAATTLEAPTYIVTSGSEGEKAAPKGGITKKHVLIAVSAVFVVAVILVAILVGMYMFSQSQKEIVKFALQFKGSDDENVKQEVESDPNDNVVMYHVTKPGQDAYVVNDFNRGMQIVKMSTAAGVNCYVSALNRTSAMDTSRITGSDSSTDKGKNEESSFVISNEPVSDRSFLAKKAQDMCKSVSLYWVTKQCISGVAQNGTVSGDRTKRAIYNVGTYFGLRGLGGCCKAYYACELVMIEYIVGAQHLCSTYYRTGTCCTPNAQYPAGVAYPYCLNVYQAPFKTPGLYC